MTTVLVCGSRSFDSPEFVFSILDAYHEEMKITKLVQGGARGVDFLAAKWAQKNNIQLVTYLPNWGKYGKGAGPKRNTEMLKENPTIIIAFPGGRGTASMVGLARLAGFTVHQISETGEISRC